MKPGQTIKASVVYDENTNTYIMNIKCVESGWSVTSTKRIQGSQIEATAYFVVEHQPNSCAAYPPDDSLTFTDIVLEVEGKIVSPTWQAQQQQPACDSSAKVLSPSSIQLLWNSKALNHDAVVKRDRFETNRHL